MTEVFIRMSGILAILIAWIFLIVPVVLSHGDARTDTITTVAGRYKAVKVLVTAGLIGGAIMQAIFIFSVSSKYYMSMWNFGCITYLSTTIATILVALLTYEKYPNIHTVLTRYYFFATPLALLHIGYVIREGYPNLFYLTGTIVLFYSLGQSILYRKYKVGNVLMEGWGLVTFSIWTLVMTFA